MSKTPIIQLSDICVAYDGKEVLHDVNLTVYENDFLGIIGPNGGGKTTLIKTILGLKNHYSGTKRFFKAGTEVSEINIGYLPQYNAIDKKFPISVFDVVLSGLNKQKNLFCRFSHEQREMCNNVITRMGLEEISNKQIGSLSGGQMQRALLGRAIISHPDLLILDEPNTYIDKQFQTKLYHLLSEINKECAIMLVSHDIGSVMTNVRSIACVNETLHYHASTELMPKGWIEQNFGCPIDLVGHGNMPHRVLKNHEHTWKLP